MSLYGALLTGVSGLDANSRALAITSSNIANVNTVGYKTSTANFSTFLAATGKPDAVTPHTRPPTDHDAQHTLVRTAECVDGELEIELVCDRVAVLQEREPLLAHLRASFGLAGRLQQPNQLRIDAPRRRRGLADVGPFALRHRCRSRCGRRRRAEFGAQAARLLIDAIQRRASSQA